MGRYVDLEGNVSIWSDPKQPVFVSYAHKDEAAHQFIQAMLDECFISGSWGDIRSTAGNQTILATAFKAVVDAWHERERQRRAKVDPNQVVEAYLANVWRYVQNLDDKEYAAVDPYKIAALMEICDPDFALTGERDDNEDPPDNH